MASLLVFLSEKFDLWLRHRFKEERKNEKHCGLQGCQRAICIWYFRSRAEEPTIIGGISHEKESLERTGVPPPFCSALDSLIRLHSTSFHESPKRWKEMKRDRRIGGIYRGVCIEVFRWLVIHFDGNVGRESLCDKLRNYGEEASVAADLWIVQGVSFNATLAFIKRITRVCSRS